MKRPIRPRALLTLLIAALLCLSTTALADEPLPVGLLTTPTTPLSTPSALEQAAARARGRLSRMAPEPEGA